MTRNKIPVFSKLFTFWSDPPKDCSTDLYAIQVKEWRWIDDRTSEYTLRSGIRYHNKPPVNGREMVAQDVPYAIERFKNMTIIETVARQVESVEVVDKYTFRLRTKAPFTGLITELMAIANGLFLLPPEAGGPKGDLWTSPEKSWIGSGPFLFKEQKPGVGSEFVRNPDYWVKGRPYVDRLQYIIAGDTSTKAALLRAGQVHLIQDVTEAVVASLVQQVEGLQIQRCPGVSGALGASSVTFDTTKPPFSDVRVRRAASMAIDQQAIINTVYYGKGTPGLQSPPAIGPYYLPLEKYPPGIRQYMEYHPDRAKQLLAEAGYPKGLDTGMIFTTRYPAPATFVAEAVVDMLGRVGIRTKLELMEYGHYMGTLYAGKYGAYGLGLSPGGFETPGGTMGLAMHTTGGVNRSLVKDSEYNRVYADYMAATEEAKGVEASHKLQIRSADQVWRVILPYVDDIVLGSPSIHATFPRGRPTSDYSQFIETLWVD